MLDAAGNIVSPDDPAKFSKAVHLNDIHLERGMHCVDCHFRQDSHGDGNLYNEPRAAIEIACEDCHGTIQQKATLFTSGPPRQLRLEQRLSVVNPQNQPLTGQDLTRIRVRDAEGARIPLFQRVTRDRKRKDEKGVDVDLKVGDIMQNSMVVPGRWWRVPQTLDTVVQGSRDYNEQSRYAKTIRKDNATWGEFLPTQSTGTSRQQHDVRCVSLFVGDELFWLSPVDAGESQDAEPSQRRRQHAQLQYNFRFCATTSSCSVVMAR